MKKKKKFGYSNLIKTIGFYRKHLGLFVFAIIVMILYAIVGFLQPIVSGQALAYISSLDFDNALKFAMILIIILLFRETLKFFNNTTYAKLNNKVVFDIKNKIINSITLITMSQIDKTNNGVFIERLHEDTRKCSDVFLEIMSVFLGVLSNVGFLIYIAFINIWFFLMLLIYVVMLWLWDTYKEKIWFKQRKLFKKKSEIATGAYNEQVRGLRDVKSLNIRKNTINAANNRSKDALDINIKSRITRSKICLGRNIMAVIFEVAFLVVGILFIKHNLISLAGFLIIYMYHGNVRSLSIDLSFLKEYCVEGELAAGRIFEVIDEYNKETFGDGELVNVAGNISIKDVSFAYDKDLVLKDINLEFVANKTTAIVGKSGSGKSTILSLINRLYHLKEGSITIDNVDINSLSESSLRGNIGLITQSPYIFNTTIRENLLLVKPKATESEMIDVLRRAQIYDYIETLDKGIDSIVGENGVMLSGGQKQRIALARLLLQNPPVIMLDEATSALDNESQGKIVEAIDSIKNEHTIIVVAHRLSTIQNADNIIVIDQGKVVDQGTHKYLIRNCKVYKDLYKGEMIEQKYNAEIEQITG